MTTARAAAAVVTCLGLVAAGCGGGADGPTLHPVSGRVEIPGGDATALAGCNIDAALDTDPTIHASGEVGPDGRFTLETLHGGKIRKGAQEGRYRVVIIFPDDDREAKRRAAKAVDPKVRKFDTSGLTIEVPAAGEVVLRVPAREKK
jgi:hypothetical protein